MPYAHVPLTEEDIHHVARCRLSLENVNFRNEIAAREGFLTPCCARGEENLRLCAQALDVALDSCRALVESRIRQGEEEANEEILDALGSTAPVCMRLMWEAILSREFGSRRAAASASSPTFTGFGAHKRPARKKPPIPPSPFPPAET